MITKTLPFQFDDGGRADAGFKGTTGDCVCRAIAIATGRPYIEVYNGLISLQATMKQTKRVRGSHPRTGVNRKIYDAYLKFYGWKWVPLMQIGSGCTHHLADGELPKGNIITRLSRHVVAVIDGVVHDTFDPSRGGSRCVYGYYIKQ